ncbi:Nitro/flavin reductase [Anaeromyces robustus]|uniref:Nitro/flavin reductase n=1 Tax=Anaeromyces robustus TaxID=1754192 RepID=A0A1Y1WPN5_9FUNG|nr:Nitro/flavin reductase [Anaeromyces robustus]|eukprot:ORX75084.1 Nitro/flavin reductase [Anaeromyces robustus]
MNPVIESLLKHQSIRKYKNQPLEQEKLDLIIKCVQAAPNWCNGQHVSVIVVKDQERKNKLAELCFKQPYIATCSVFLIFCADNYRTNLIFEKYGSKEEGDKWTKTCDNLFVGAHECGIAMQNAVVAAESMGLGTVPIGAIRLNSLELINMLNLPKYVLPMIGLCVGYPDDDPGQKPRLPTNTVCFDEKYDSTNLLQKIEEHDKSYQKYLANRSDNDRDSTWSKSIYDMYSRMGDIYYQDYELVKKQGFIPVEKLE